MIKRHGNRVIDYTHYFEIPRDKGSREYSINIWFFIPKTLMGNSYNKDDFFMDLSSYTRYNAPNLNFSSLVDLDNEKNPLFRLAHLKSSGKDMDKVEYEIKTLVNSLKTSCKKNFITLRAMKGYSSFEAGNNMKLLVNRMNSILENFYQLYKKSSKKLDKPYLLGLEGVSIEIEKTLYKFYNLSLDNDFVINEINKQRDFRKKMGFKSITTEDEGKNSRVVYREHIIKKWAESIMYIENESSKTHKGIKHLFLGSAAAIAMLIAGVLTIIAARWFGEESIYWFLVALIAYSLKDRIKDILKVILLNRAFNVMSDRIRKIVSPGSRINCGKFKESVDFPDFELIPENVRELRFNFKDDIDIIQYQEGIIHYSRKVKLNTKRLYKNHSRLFGIREIMRFDLRRWFYKMDKISEKCYMPIDGKLGLQKGEREYHFSVIVNTIIGKENQYKSYSIIANNKKIKIVKDI